MQWGTVGVCRAENTDDHKQCVAVYKSIRNLAGGVLTMVGSVSGLAFGALLTASLTCSLGWADGIPDLIAEAEPSVVQVEVELRKGSSLGSGFVINGDVVTNWHVVKGATSVEVVFADKSSHKCDGLLAVDVDRDIAVLSAPTLAGRKGLRLSPTLPRKGETVVAFGAPRGFSFTTSDGIVSGVRSSDEIKRELGKTISQEDVMWVQTTAPISQGNSGGPLIGLNGEVYGVNTWYYKQGQNLNFASACTEVARVVNRASARELTAFSEAPKEASLAAGDADTKLQRVLHVQHTADFERKLSDAVVLHNVRCQLYEMRAKDPRASLWELEIAKKQYEEARQAVEELAEWKPEVDRLGQESSLVGRPGSFYVLQVIAADAALIKSSRSSDVVMMVRGISTVGLADRVTRDFEGVWFTTGDTYTYNTVGGSSRTVYALEAVNTNLEGVLSTYRDAHVRPAVAKAIENLSTPAIPVGEAAETIDTKRRINAARRLQQQQEEDTLSAMRNAKRFAVRRPEVSRRLYKEVVDEHPDTGMANVARRRLGLSTVPHFRWWQSGEYARELAFVSANDTHVVLEGRSGKQTTVALSRLSDQDREYVTRVTAD